MKILIISNGSLNKTGVPCLILELCKLLVLENHNVNVLYFSKSGNTILNDFKSLGINLLYSTKTKHIKKISTFLKAKGPFDAIHCFNEYDSLSYLVAAKINKINIRIMHTNSSVHNSKYQIKNIYYKIIRHFINTYSTHKLGCSSEACKSAFGSKSQYKVFPNPYDENKYFYHEIKNKPTPITLVQVGSIQPNKNQMFSIQVLEKLLKYYPRSFLYIIGNVFYKDYYEKINNYLNTHKIKSHIKFLNYDANQIHFFDKSDYMIFPSLKEGFGTVLLEAQSVGLKCIASNTVPKSTNFGGVLYLDLQESSSEWAKLIVNDYELGLSKRKRYNIYSHTSNNLIKIIRGIYGIK